MASEPLKITYIGGPTALLEWGGLRLLTDPAFDPAGSEYDLGHYKLRKTADPAVPAASLGRVDIVLLSHDHHFDNLDHAGRALLPAAGMVLTTPAGAQRLGGNASGFDNWQAIEVPAPRGRVLRITGTPARHGPAGGDRGPVTGFALAFADNPAHAVYVSGDTVWYEGVAEVAQRFSVRLALLFMGAAQIPEIGVYHITMTADDAIQASRAFSQATIVPLHYEGWAHFSESRDVITHAFHGAGTETQVRWLERAASIDFPL